MDRRYEQTRFYNGSRADESRSEKSDRLVRTYLARARRSNNASQAYGGSTGGAKSAGGGLAVVVNRNADIKDARELFRTEGSGSFGARANLAEVRGFRQPRVSASSVPPAG